MPVRASGDTAFSIKGIKNVERTLKRIARATAAEMPSALYEAGEGIMRQSKEIVPVKTSALKNSGRVHDPETRGGSIRVQLSYGGAASDYAIVQHERTDYNHPGQGEPKYLQRPLNEARTKLARQLGDKAKVVIRRAAR